MDHVKEISRRSFIMIMLFMSLLLFLADQLYDMGLAYLAAQAAHTLATEQADMVADSLSRAQAALKLPFVGIAAGVFFGVGLLLWGMVRVTMPQAPKALPEKPLPEKKAKPQVPVESKQERMEKDRRMYLHLLSVFQREGRLVDFFAEDLSLYQDDQIGAAVRNIQENCKNTMDKYLKPVAVIDQNEGDEITIDAPFNADEIKLIGNVSGNPPFKGILRHKGWKVNKTELPKLAAGTDSRLIAPAEVEIL